MNSASPDSGILSDARFPELDSGTLEQDAAMFTDADANTASFVVPDCIEAIRSSTTPSLSFEDTRGLVSVGVQGTACQKSYHLETTQAFPDPRRAQFRDFEEDSSFPVIRTGNEIFDALYALGITEMKENAVDAISDHAFNNGQPILCPSGGCFETGELWHYIWTRDISYAADLSLAALDPVRVKNSLEFKLSERRRGGDLQIVQDTGTGGSYPVSTDRIVWALGAYRSLHFLSEPERTSFEARVRSALNNTLTHDRVLVFDEENSLYRGESSFLDWREQTYPAWVQNDVVHIGMSKSFSTNVLYFRALRIASELNRIAGDNDLADQQSLQSEDLRSEVNRRFTLSGEALYGAFLPTTLDSAASHRFELLGSALAILAEVPSSTRAQAMLSSYPHTGFGAPVIWPQQKNQAIYHNRAVWPFVSSYWMKAARKRKNSAVLAHNFDALIRASGLNLSNMENLEFTSGLPWLDDGRLSGPVINSRRQLWSVAGYLSAIHDLLFGLESTLTGIRFLPAIDRKIHSSWFSSSDRIALNRFSYRGKQIHVEVSLPNISASSGFYSIASIRLNDQEIGTRYFQASELESKNVLSIRLAAPAPKPSNAIEVLSATNGENIFAPSTPQIDRVERDEDDVAVVFNIVDELDNNIIFNIYRDGVRVASGLSGVTRRFVDATGLGNQTPGHCYAVEAEYRSSGLVSQRSKPSCFWGDNYERIWSVYAGDFLNVGGTLVDRHGWLHYEGWGAASDELRISGFMAQTSGRHLIHLIYGNGAGDSSSGITCAVKRLRVFEAGTQNLISSDYVIGPHLGDWGQWRDGSFLSVDLQSGQGYDFVIDQDDYAVNMSFFEHFSDYTGGLGGADAYNNVNISELRVLALSPL